jgi:hypothetical protein
MSVINLILHFQTLTMNRYQMLQVSAIILTEITFKIKNIKLHMSAMNLTLHFQAPTTNRYQMLQVSAIILTKITFKIKIKIR